MAKGQKAKRKATRKAMADHARVKSRGISSAGTVGLHAEQRAARTKSGKQRAAATKLYGSTAQGGRPSMSKTQKDIQATIAKGKTVRKKK